MTDVKQATTQLNNVLDRILQNKNNPAQIEQAVNEARQQIAHLTQMQQNQPQQRS